MTFGDVMGMVGRTLQSPREGAEEVLAIGVPRESLWLFVGLVTVLSVIVSEISVLFARALGRVEQTAFMPGAILSLFLILGSVLLLIILIHKVGRAFGGAGALDETIVVVCWLQFVSAVLAVAHAAITLASPTIGALAAIVVIGIQLWLLTNFVAVVHGFRSLGKVFFSILGVSFAVGLILLFVLTAMGLAPQPAGGA